MRGDEEADEEEGKRGLRHGDGGDGARQAKRRGWAILSLYPSLSFSRRSDPSDRIIRPFPFLRRGRPQVRLAGYLERPLGLLLRKRGRGRDS